MITQRHFFKKTKKGSILKIVNEVYLREDISCGLLDCEKCLKQEIVIKEETSNTLDKNSRIDINKKIEHPHLIALDASCFLNEIDVIEDESFGKDIIIFQSVLEEIRKKNLQIYLRVKQLIQTKKCFVFVNLFNVHTFAQKKQGETKEEHDDRLVRLAVKWYSEHLSEKILVILLTTLKKSKLIAKNENIKCLLLDEYVEGLRNCENLIDKLSKKEDSEIVAEDQFLFEKHLELSQIQEGIKNGIYYQGKFQTNQQNYLEGFVSLKLNEEDVTVLIQGKESINRAIHEDIVAITLLPKSEWKRKSDVILIPEENNFKEQENIEQDVESIHNDQTNSILTAKVVGIIKRNWRQYCGVLRLRDEELLKSMVLTSHLFVPVEKRIPIVRIETRQYENLKNQRIIVAIDSWPRNSRYPKGHYVRSLGEIGDKATETEVVLLEHDVPYLEFTKAVLNCLPNPNTWEIPQKEYELRLDLRDYNICSVDPPGCTDIDDALHCRILNQNEIEVGVHIADVSYFVKQGSHLDLEACNRGTTVYLVDKRIDMIPNILSSNLCSLIEKQERLTFSVIWKLNKNTGEVLDTKFVKSIIRSKGAFTYAEAQLKIDTIGLKDELTQSLRNLNEMAKVLRKNRIEKGAVVLANMGELKFVEVESETHDNVIQIESKQLNETNSMVEEFMLLANISVAKKLYEEFPSLALLRRHPKPSMTNFVELEESLKAKGFEIDLSSNKSFSQCLDKIKDNKNSYLNLMVRILATRCMTQALYFCSGSLANMENNFHHFGLAVEMYTHFTSPIRRYADLIVHRLLSHAINYEILGSELVSKDNIQKICENINYRHRKAQYANRASVKLHTLLFVQNSKVPLKEEGYVLYVKKNALNIFIPRLALEVIYYLDPPTDWEKNIHNFSLTQTHIKSGIKLKQFDKVTIILQTEKQTSLNNRGQKLITKIIEPRIDK